MRTTKNVTRARLAIHVMTNTTRTVPTPAPARPTRRTSTSRRSIKERPPWIPILLGDEQDAYGASIQISFGYASEEEPLDTTRAAGPDVNQIRLRRSYGLKQFSQARPDEPVCGNSPSSFPKPPGDCSMLPLLSAHSLSVDSSTHIKCRPSSVVRDPGR